MSKNVWCLVTAVTLISTCVYGINADWVPAADPNAAPGAPALWSEAANWSGGVVPNSLDYEAWVATANSRPCLLEGYIQIYRLKLGEGGDGSNNGHLIVRGTLDTGTDWQGIGAWTGNVGVLEVDGGVFNTYGGAHLWIGNSGDGTVIIKNGGEVNVGVNGGAQIGHGWNGDGFGRTFIYDGLLTVNNWTDGSIHPDTPSFIDIEKGTLSIAGYRIYNPAFTNPTSVDLCAQDGRITGFRNAKFDKKLNIDNPGSNRENDVINNVVMGWDGSRTLVTAIHPQQPSPYLDEAVIFGDIEFAWNNWDPNEAGDSVLVDVWVGTDPNKLGSDYTKVISAMDVTGQARSSAVINIPAAGVYYWQVDVQNGPASFHEGDLFSFVAEAYKAPVLTARSVITTTELLPATIPAAVTNNSSAITLVDFALLTDDIEFPDGANAVVTNITTDNQQPTAELTTDMAGRYKIKLTVSDGTTTLEKTVQVDIYSDACQAKKDSPSGWAANYYDRDGDCDVDLSDFAQLATAWMNDTSMQVQETRIQSGNATYVPQSVFDGRIEAESVDPDAVSDAPVTDEQGVRIVSEDGATGGGQALGWTGTGAWAEYVVTLEAGTYDIYVSSASPDAAAILSFGTAADPDLYGTVGPLPNYGGWGSYGIKKYAGALTFGADDTYVIRISWTNQANLDWFALVKQ